MQRHAWPGNVRELENAIERAVVLCRRPQIDVEDLPETIQSAEGSGFGVQGSGKRDMARRASLYFLNPEP
jgi:DNA-binding NtrC family response regulator